MSALPAEPEHGYPHDPQRILAELPADERGMFLAQYRRAAEAALNPEGWAGLAQVLRLWSKHVAAMKQPGYRENREQARRPASGGMLLDDFVRARHGG